MEEHPRIDNITTILKSLVPNSKSIDGYDSIVNFVISKVIDDVASYTHIPVIELPEELDKTIVSICMQLMESHQLLVPIEDKNTDVAALSEGDTSVTFKSPATVYTELQLVNTLTDNYLMILNNYRRIKY
ncbi:hypothetical protein M5C72_06265 [Companilactobacillus allii]|uniref:Uncharacterized protein n=1 Tax=Companilactobacillus allii TaxID=1847728 RepID=A0A1P8Q4B1_9LACO|nr:hypothetical protein [Companilactobacillus allii]APX72711.1 hypothetical protein BTM29_09175 [Companilactobacillus allii]USQ69818.1 hypothetical protein M5C72_06265 [Companilactobacillus allii]